MNSFLKVTGWSNEITPFAFIVISMYLYVIGLVQRNIKSYTCTNIKAIHMIISIYFLVDKCTCKDILETRLLGRTKAMICIILRQRKYIFIAKILQVKHMSSVSNGSTAKSHSG